MPTRSPPFYLKLKKYILLLRFYFFRFSSVQNTCYLMLLCDLHQYDLMSNYFHMVIKLLKY